MLSNTYHPSPELAPYIRRFYIFEAELPGDHVIEDTLLAETAFVRCLVVGDWRGSDAPAELSRAGRALFFGANGKPYKVRLTGGFHTVGFAIRPSGWGALFPRPHNEYVDTLIPLEDLWGDMATEMHEGIVASSTDAQKVAVMESIIKQRIEQIGKPKIDQAMAQFEAIARTDSTMRIDEVAEQVGLSVRQLERRCKATFGLTPKAVLRRSRFLDMATAMRGFSSPSDADLAALRYFDQSHLNREFKRFTNMTPRQFKLAVTVMQTAGLKLREESLYEE